MLLELIPATILVLFSIGIITYTISKNFREHKKALKVFNKGKKNVKRTKKARSKQNRR